jgi:hypothetical protein
MVAQDWPIAVAWRNVSPWKANAVPTGLPIGERLSASDQAGDQACVKATRFLAHFLDVPWHLLLHLRRRLHQWAWAGVFWWHHRKINA